MTVSTSVRPVSVAILVLLALPAVVASDDTCENAARVTPTWSAGHPYGAGWYDEYADGTSTTDWEDWAVWSVYGGEEVHLVLSSSYSHRGGLRNTCSSAAWGILFPDTYKTWTQVASGDVYARVYLTTGTGHGNYVMWTEIHPRDGGVHAQEAGDTAASATPVPASGGPWPGTLDARGGADEDWWIVPTSVGRVTVWATPQECGLDADLQVYGPDGILGASSARGCGQDAVRCYAAVPTLLHARIHPAAGAGRYAFHARTDATLPTPGEPLCG